MKRAPLTKRIWGWALYDFANSAYATTMITAIFSVYFVTSLAPAEGFRLFGSVIPAASVWSYLVTLIMLCVIFLSPFLGALADRKSMKRSFLLYWTLLGGGATMFLYGATPGRFAYGFWLAFVSYLSFEMVQVFYNAFLNDVSVENERGRISGFGFAIGYIGGGLCLGLNMLMIGVPHVFGLSTADPSTPIRSSFFVVGVWWLLFSLPFFLWVRDSQKSIPAETPPHPLTQLFLTLKKVIHYKQCGRFLLAFVIYNDGIQTLIIMASIFGAQVLGMSIQQLGLCILLVQFVAFFGAMLFGRWADQIGHKRTVLITLVIYLLISIWALFMKSHTEFWILGVIVGLVLGGSQAASRSLYTEMIPRHQEGEFFSLYAIVGKAASVLGPLVFGVITQWVGLRAGVGSLVVFFFLGGLILLTVNEEEGKSQARRDLINLL